MAWYDWFMKNNKTTKEKKQKLIKDNSKSSSLSGFLVGICAIIIAPTIEFLFIDYHWPIAITFILGASAIMLSSDAINDRAEHFGLAVTGLVFGILATAFSILRVALYLKWLFY